MSTVSTRTEDEIPVNGYAGLFDGADEGPTPLPKLSGGSAGALPVLFIAAANVFEGIVVVVPVVPVVPELKYPVPENPLLKLALIRGLPYVVVPVLRIITGGPRI